MDDKLTIVGICCLILVAASKTDARNDDLSERLEKLEQRFARNMALFEERIEQRYAREMKLLEERIEQRHAGGMALLEERIKQRYSSDIVRLEQRVVKLEFVNKQLATENESNKALISSLGNQLKEYKTCKNDHDEKKTASVVRGGTGDNKALLQSKLEMPDEVSRAVNTESAKKERDHVNINHRRALLERNNIAFSAYLNHDLDNQGPDQVIVFNKVLLNHGNAFNINSGMFTAPIAGVYSFTFVIGERDVNEYSLSLVVNSQRMVDAVCETFHATQDLQSKNTANLMLAKGDIVFVRHYGTGTHHMEGAESYRITTFSGFLIYPVETPINVIGK